MLLDERPFTASRQPACCRHWSRPGDDLSVGDGGADGSGFLKEGVWPKARPASRSAAAPIGAPRHGCHNWATGVPRDHARRTPWLCSCSGTAMIFGLRALERCPGKLRQLALCLMAFAVHTRCASISVDLVGCVRKEILSTFCLASNLDLLQVMCLGSVRWMHASTMHGVAFGPCRPAMSVLKLKHRHEDRDCDVTSCQDPRPGGV